MREFQKIVPLVLKAIALAMAVVTLVLNIMGDLETETAIFFLAVGLFALAVSSLQQSSVSDVEKKDSAESTHPHTTPSSSQNPLTDRELEIVGLLDQSLSNREIADRLYLAEGTVKNYLTTLMQKLDAQNRDEAVRRAYELGLL